jgi:DNA-binding transcriptional ArsR family regulator
MTTERRPAGFDPARDILLDAHNLRGLAHPVRMRLLSLLREHGPATATQLAARLGESSATTSYHLRQLAAYGFIVDDERPARGRERWWRAAHRSTYFEMPDAGEPADRVLAEEYLRNVIRANAARMEASLDAWPTTPQAWRAVSNISNYVAWLTPEQAGALTTQLEALGTRLRDEHSTRRPGTAAVTFQFQVLPDAGGRVPAAKADGQGAGE